MVHSKSPAHKRYTWRIAAAMGAYLVTLFAAEILIDDRGLSGPLAWVVALLPGLCVASVFWAVARLLIEEKDEYIRSLLVRQMLTASGLALVVATIYGFLENYGLVPHVAAFYLSIVFFFGLGVGSIVNRVMLTDIGALLMENRLKVLRAQRNWSQADLGERLEVSRQSVNAIETGKYDPSLPLAFRIAELFDLPIEEIFESPNRRRSGAI